MKDKKRVKTNIGLEYVVKVGDTEEKTREGRTRQTRKEVVVFVQAVLGKKKFVFQF